MRNFIILCCLFSVFLSSCRMSDPLTITSPDRSIVVNVSTDSSGSPSMDLSVDGLPFMKLHKMGLEGFPFGNPDAKERLSPEGFHIIKTEPSHLNRRWNQPWGENKTMVEHYNGCTYLLHNDHSKIDLFLDIRVFNDGIGFRYRYLCDSLSSQLSLTGESTTFHFLDEGTSWSIPANFESYEFPYRQQPLSEVADANTPFTFRLNNGIWGSIHEAALLSMPEMTLKHAPEHNSLCSWLCPDNTGSGTVALTDAHISTSWRTITIGRKAVDLVNSSLILNLNEPCINPLNNQFHPMKYIGIWWGMHLGINSWTPDHRHGATTENALRYIDFAAQNNIDAVLFEGWNTGWDQWGGNQVFSFTSPSPDMNMDSVINYAHQLGVEVIVHHETGGNIPNYESQLDSALQWCKQRNIRAIKTGYAGGFPLRHLHHSQYGVNHYTKVTQATFNNGIAIDVHEPIKPTGLRRTYPNIMSAEGGRGMEWNAWSDGNPPSHQTILPFTRLLAGPMDYTPGIFDITYQNIQNNPNCRKWNMMDARECRVHSTLGHQVALWVVLYSPLQMAADMIENYLSPESCDTIPQNTCSPSLNRTTNRDDMTKTHPMFEFFRQYDPDCDWSKALEGEPGKYFAVVRSAGRRFFLGAVTNEEARHLCLNTDFLPKNKEYRITIYGDAPDADFRTNPTAYIISTHVVHHGDNINLYLAPGGGCAAILEPTSKSCSRRH